MSAVHHTDCGQARVTGMKIRAMVEPPVAATGSFPYPHRSCAEWQELPGGKFVDREMTDEERMADAVEGSAKLRDAIKSMVA